MTQSNDAKIEQMVKEYGADQAPRVTKDHIDRLMARVQYQIVSRPGGTTSTFVHAYLDGAFFLGTGFSAAVSEANFREEIGLEVAKTKAENAARDKLWELEGYALFCHVAQYDKNS